MGLSRFFRRVFIFIGVVWACTGLAVASAETLEELDRIVMQASSLEDFLGHPQWVDQYYAAASRYYGVSRFPRVSFDAILDQLRQVNAKVPGLAQRLWETTELGSPFSIQTAVKSHGRDVNIPAWHALLGDWRAKAVEQSPMEPSKLSPAAELTRSKELLRSLRAKITRFEAESAASDPLLPVSRKEMESRARVFYETLKKNPEIGLLADAIVASRASEFETLMKGKFDSDLILNEVEQNKKNAGKWAAALLAESDLPSVLVAEVQRRVLQTSELLKNEAVFPKSMIQAHNRRVEAGTSAVTSYDFRPVPRRFHGIFEGIPLGECVGGSCKSLDQLTPERWAVIALKGSQRQHLERGGGYLGFVQLVPVQRKKTREVYLSADYGSPQLRQNIVTEDGETGELFSSRLYQLWLEHMNTHLPPGTSGIVVGESTAIDNAGVIGDVHSSSAYLLGKPLGSSLDFNHLDPLASRLVGALPAQGFAKYYGGRMIFDGFVKNSGKLRQLSSRIPWADLGDPEKLRAALESGDALKIQSWLEGLGGKSSIKAELARMLLDFYTDRGPVPGLDSMALIKALNRSGSSVTENLTRLSERVFGGTQSTNPSRALKLLDDWVGELGQKDRSALAQSKGLVSFYRSYLETGGGLSSSQIPRSLFYIMKKEDVLSAIYSVIVNGDSQARARAVSCLQGIHRLSGEIPLSMLFDARLTRDEVRSVLGAFYPIDEGALLRQATQHASEGLFAELRSQMILGFLLRNISHWPAITRSLLAGVEKGNAELAEASLLELRAVFWDPQIHADFLKLTHSADSKTRNTALKELAGRIEKDSLLNDISMMSVAVENSPGYSEDARRLLLKKLKQCPDFKFDSTYRALAKVSEVRKNRFLRGLMELGLANKFTSTFWLQCAQQASTQELKKLFESAAKRVSFKGGCLALVRSWL